MNLTWAGKWTFILAAAGSAVGLGNIWGFAYTAGMNGGGAFVLIYLACILVIGLPIMTAEIMLGKRYRSSPVGTMEQATLENNSAKSWQAVGWAGLAAGLLILSFYSVIAGICLNYVLVAFNVESGSNASAVFGEIIASPKELIVWHSLFVIATLTIIASGVLKGIEKMINLLMPLLFIIMLLMVINAMVNGDFIRGLEFLFNPDFSKVTAQTFLSAMGQAFFSLSLGMGAIMCYGAYMPKEHSIYKSSSIVASLDTLIALMAGLAIFPIIFAYGVEPSRGPSLVFVSLLSIFADMPLGNWVGALFFIGLSIAALSSGISLLEPSVAYLAEKKILSRVNAALLLSFIAWFLGLGSVFSFNIWQDVQFIGARGFLDSMLFLSNQILLPLGGLFICLYVGWKLDKNIAREELGGSDRLFSIWYLCTAYIAPLFVFLVFIFQFI